MCVCVRERERKREREREILIVFHSQSAYDGNHEFGKEYYFTIFSSVQQPFAFARFDRLDGFGS